MVNLKYAPYDIFQYILEYAVIPTFDLIIEFNRQGVIIVRRRVSPYKNQWALPGLRMMRPENIRNTLTRIGNTEIGVKINPSKAKFVGQYVGKFRTENNRQDLSTCYSVTTKNTDFTINRSHFSGHKFIRSLDAVPESIGSMYKYYLRIYFADNKHSGDV